MQGLHYYNNNNNNNLLRYISTTILGTTYLTYENIITSEIKRQNFFYQRNFMSKLHNLLEKYKDLKEQLGAVDRHTAVAIEYYIHNTRKEKLFHFSFLFKLT